MGQAFEYELNFGCVAHLYCWIIYWALLKRRLTRALVGQRPIRA